MKKLRISASRLKTLLDCKWKYFCKYIQKYPDATNEKAKLGSLIHTIYECVMSPKKTQRRALIQHSVDNGTLHPTVKRMYDKLHKKDQYVNEELYELGIKLLLNGFIYGFDFNIKILSTEFEFEVDLGDNISSYGFIDRIQEVDSETLEVLDYKSGQPYSVADIEKDFQVYLYLHAARTLFPGYKNYLFSFHFLKNKKTCTVSKPKSEVDNFMRYVKAQAPIMRNMTEADATPTRSFKCKFCSFREPIPSVEYKGCKLYNNS